MSEEMDPAEKLLVEETARYSIINETINVGTSPVQQFYSGAVVLVTGGSGFLGKQLIEKLLRSAKIEKLYMLLRRKKNKTIEERMQKFLEEPVFEYLNEHQPDFKEKIIPIMGDVAEINLNMKVDDWQTITDEVTVVIHGAATINFTEPLRIAAVTNVRGTREIIKLAKECKKLKSFVHISTAYCHATAETISEPVLEKFYKSPIAPEALLQLVDSLNDEKLDAITPELIKNWPNTYSFTKAVAEEVVRIYAADLPTCIVRPAIVVCAKREPEPGWIDMLSVFGATGIVVGCAVGVVHLLLGSGDVKLDFVPVDIVNNAVIVAAHETAVRWGRGDTDTQIYTVTGTRDPISLDGLIRNVAYAGDEIASPKIVWHGYAFPIKNSLFYTTLAWFLHYIPGYLVDSILQLIGKKPMLMPVYDKMLKLNGVLEYYMKNDWNFDDSNLMTLHENLTSADKNIYECNMIPMDWRRYILFWCIGCRKYIFKDGLKDTPFGLRRRKIFRYFNALAIALYIYLFYLLFKYVFNVIFG